MGMSKIKLSRPAHAIILLHAFKCPHAAVCGVLVGHCEGENIVVERAVPIAHGHINMAPVLEMALTQVEAKYCPSFELLGYYQANAHPQDSEIGESGQKIGEKIRAQTKDGHGCMLLVDSSS